MRQDTGSLRKSLTQHNYDARRLFRKAKETIGYKPKILITDGLPPYREAYLEEFYTMSKATRTEHIHSIRIQGNGNNKMERLNGEIRDREKVMRGLKKPETSIIPGYQIYHNYVRPHEALDGKPRQRLAESKSKERTSG